MQRLWESHSYLEAFSHLKIRLFTPGGAPNLEPRDDIWPTDVAPIIRANKDGAELIQLRWGFPPGRPKGPPVINMPSEKRRFTKVGEDWFCIAGLWRPVEGGAAAFTMLTCEPGPDVAPIHNRQVVVLDRSERAAWLNSQTAEEDP